MTCVVLLLVDVCALQVDGGRDGVEGLQSLIRSALDLLLSSQHGHRGHGVQKQPILTSDLEHVLSWKQMSFT